MATQTIPMTPPAFFPPVIETEVRTSNKLVVLLTAEPLGFIDVTEFVNQVVRQSGIAAGFVHVQSMHASAGMFVSEWNTERLAGAKSSLEHLAGPDSRHRIMGQSVSLQVHDSRVVLGQDHSIIVSEFDGPGTRPVSVQVIGI
jgi:thiamine phosphate synthase YjbQ (UPF0047 family)